MFVHAVFFLTKSDCIPLKYHIKMHQINVLNECSCLSVYVYSIRYTMRACLRERERGSVGFVMHFQQNTHVYECDGGAGDDVIHIHL